MENNLENKAKFFALYWGQRVLCIEGGDKKIMPISHWNTIQTNENFNKAWLELKSISSISDLDAFKIGFGNRNSFLAINKEMYIYHVNSVDYLRSKGYALPFMGITVEKLIEYRWVKLKDNA